jgi:hypothetical protein
MQTNKLNHKELSKLLQRAYSAEKAAAFAYQGHAGSVKSSAEKTRIHEIEIDEWNHRSEVLLIMQDYGIPVSKLYEVQFYCIGKVISASCYVIGWFMPYFFAGKLESGNVCEYFRMMQMFHELGITKHNNVLYFLNSIRNNKLLPLFQKVFKWGVDVSANNVDLEAKYPVEQSKLYCSKE